MNEPRSTENASESDTSSEDWDETKSVEPDPLYDQDLDDVDEEWVQKHFGGGKGNTRPTDAVLSCPCCFASLCFDCQRHDLYPTQFRAMFVCGCRVVTSEVLRYKKREDRGRKGKKSQETSIAEDIDSAERVPSDVKVPQGDADEVYFPVQCEVCSTEVGVYDKEEVYHFFNVIPSD